MSKRIHGVLAPVVPPFKADLSPDRELFIRHCQWLISQNCALAPFGTTSEANAMSADERISLLESLVAAGIDPSHIEHRHGDTALRVGEGALRGQATDGSTFVAHPPFDERYVGDPDVDVFVAALRPRVRDLRDPVVVPGLRRPRAEVPVGVSPGRYPRHRGTGGSGRCS